LLADPEEGEADVKGKASGVSAGQRQFMQYLRAGNWVMVSKLPNPIGERLFDRILQNGWIERRGTGLRLEIKITPAGLAALRAPV
jgi:hypothetical protein